MLIAPYFWYKTHSFLSNILRPFSFLYRIIIKARRYLYAMGIKKIKKFSVPVIVVGNITVGGSGKTPMVIWLANALKKKGFHPGLVSRGYRGQGNRLPHSVSATSDPKKVGDEAVLLAMKTQCPMVVCRNRSAAVQQLLHDFYCDIVISDDGLQHYALGRNIEIALLDNRSLGNKRCLPAGPLREPMSRLNMVHFIITKRLRSIEIYQLQNSEKKIYFDELENLTVHAVAGIGNPEYFFQELKILGAHVITHPFPDHYLYRLEDFNFDDDHPIILTEKDAIKCKQFNNERLFCLSVDAVIHDQFQQDFFQYLKTSIAGGEVRNDLNGDFKLTSFLS